MTSGVAEAAPDPDDRDAPDAASSSTTPHEDGKTRRRRWWRTVFAAYAVLLVASHVTQWVMRSPDPRPRGDATVTEVPRRGVDGTARAGDRPVAIAWTRGGSEDPADGPLHLLLHGSPGDLTNFDEMVAALPDGARWIAVDLPGFGRSARAIPDYSPRVHAAYLQDLLDEIAPGESVHVVGFSMGGVVALRMIEIDASASASAAAPAPGRVASVIMLAATGIQEGEGSGDYEFEQLKYHIGWGLFVGLPELVPHFGLLGDGSMPRSFIRNFMDADMRPMREVIESTDVPFLVLHGENDFLVPPWTAREHHRLAPTSELVMTDGDHFDPFDPERAADLSARIVDFTTRVAAGGPVGDRVDDPGWEAHEASGGDPTADLPVVIGVKRAQDPFVQMTVVALATFVSEDLTCIAAGLLARRGVMDLAVAVLGCTLGIFIGDILLWLIGRVLGRRVLRIKWFARKLPPERLEKFGGWIDRNAGRAIITSRFVPGTRLPLYVAAGMLGQSTFKFIAWFLVAALLWTPFVVVLVFLLGMKVVEPLENLLGDSWIAIAVAIVLLFMAIRVVEMSFTRKGRRRIKAGTSRLWRWEFWPAFIFYLPIVPWIVWLTIRNRGFNLVTAVNPGIPYGGFVGEEKSGILHAMDQRWVLAASRIEPADIDARVADLRAAMAELELAYPVILKPEVGERGNGVRLVSNETEAIETFELEPEPLVVQRYHAGPHEAGIFYVREPGHERGRIFAVTHKIFPSVTGDGVSTLEELIWRHPRYLMQAKTFCRRWETRLEEVIPDGVSLRLAEAGNHSMGTMFVDGEFLVTPELTARIDEIARGFEGGFDFGRFDIRYRDQEELKRGEGLAIIEVNGATSEATNLYDPGRGLTSAYRTLVEQWSILFAIGAANRDAGVRPTPHGQLVRAIWRHLRRDGRGVVSD